MPVAVAEAWWCKKQTAYCQLYLRGGWDRGLDLKIWSGCKNASRKRSAAKGVTGTGQRSAEVAGAAIGSSGV